MTGPTASVPPIVLTTDFGLSDAFVGVMKGVILNINPHATIIDLTHDIGPQDLRQGAFVLGVNHTYFPLGSIHVSVVDPGVGTSRRAIVLETPAAKFVAPDNGLLSEVVKPYLDSIESVTSPASTISLAPSLRAYELTNPSYRLSPVSSTFHGRDVFAPAAAYLSLGVAPEEMGPPVSQIVYNPLPEPVVGEDRLVGEVVYIDRFGNLITNIKRSKAMDERADLEGAIVEIGSHQIHGLSATFHDAINNAQTQPNDLPLVALFGSNGYLEVAIRDGNAASTLELGVGASASLTFGP